ncbi:MAG TPA: hypothetical protein PLA19_04370 [Candidatus Pacearchaeota archaeon]|nr:hypothetical protein [Candidatus Pacearchaeota archaeon]
MIFWLVMLLFLPIALANPPAVSCIGGDNEKTSEITTDGTNAWQTFYAEENDRITLKGNSGFWENQNGQKISDGSSLTFAVKESDSYVLKTANGDFIATVNVVSLSSCVPEWRSEVEINDDEYDEDNTKIVAAGEELDFSVKVGSNCKKKYQVEWSVNPSSAVAFDNPRSLSTKGYVANDYSGKNPVVTVAIISENGERRREKTVNLMVIKNSPPAIKVRIGSSIASYKSFEVSLEESTTGRSGDEDGDYISEIEVWLNDANGKLVSHRRKTMDHEKPLPVLSLTPGSIGQYTLTAQITDRYGATDTADVTILVTEKGDSGRDKPMIDVPEDIYCAEGSCDFSVRSVDKNVFIDYFYQGKKMVKPFNLPPGDHEILIKAYSLDENGRRKNEITKTVYAHVTADSNTSAIAEPANMAPIAREDPTETQKSPPGIVPLAIGLFAAALFARRRMSAQKDEQYINQARS